MKNSEIIGQLPVIADSLVDVIGVQKEEVRQRKVQYMGITLTGKEGQGGGASFRDGKVVNQWGKASAYAGTQTDEQQLGAIDELYSADIRLDPISYYEKHEAVRTALGALVRIADKTNPENMGMLHKWQLGRRIKKVTKAIISHAFEVDIVGFEPNDKDEKIGPPPGTNPEFIAEHRESFSILEPFFREDQQARIQAALGSS